MHNKFAEVSSEIPPTPDVASWPLSPPVFDDNPIKVRVFFNG
jgi:hypothetical protein